MIIKRFLTLSALIIVLILSLPGYGKHGSEYYDVRTYARAKIVSIEKEDVNTGQGQKLTRVMVRMKILDGQHEGEIKTATFGGESDLPKDLQYKEGETYFIGISTTAAEASTQYISIYDVDNTVNIIILLIFMIFAIVLVGRVKGIASLAALTITILLLFLILIPLTLKGYPPLPIAIAICIFSIIITLPIIAGLHLKTLGAILGASGGIITASLLAITAGWIMHLSGLVTDDMLTVFYLSDVNIDIRGILLAGMIIAALGAIMDICISISSSTAEIFSANKDITEKEAFKSVLTIGTDILGSMVNTLILAYVGSSLSLILLISLKLQPGMPFWMVLNYNPVLSEIVKSIIGSIGMFVSIPLTAFISVKLYKRRTAMTKMSG